MWVILHTEAAYIVKAKICGTCMSGVCVELDEEWYHKIRTVATHTYALHQIDNIVMVKVYRHTISHTLSCVHVHDPLSSSSPLCSAGSYVQ